MGNVVESLFFVFSNPAGGRDDEFNTWYDDTHLHEVLAVPGVVAAQRYQLSPLEVPESEHGTVPPPAHGYLAVYTVDGEPSAVMNDFLARLTSGQMTLSESLDMGSVSMGFWTARGPRLTSS